MRGATGKTWHNQTLFGIETLHVLRGSQESKVAHASMTIESSWSLTLKSRAAQSRMAKANSRMGTAQQKRPQPDFGGNWRDWIHFAGEMASDRANFFLKQLSSTLKPSWFLQGFGHLWKTYRTSKPAKFEKKKSDTSRILSNFTGAGAHSYPPLPCRGDVAKGLLDCDMATRPWRRLARRFQRPIQSKREGNVLTWHC